MTRHAVKIGCHGNGSPLRILLLLFLSSILASVLPSIVNVNAMSICGPPPSNSPPSNYLYFAYGSNMVSATMTALRQLEPIDAKAAILLNYRLRFNIPGIPAVEPSWACIEESKPSNSKSSSSSSSSSSLSSSSAVHGILYTLTAEDFAKVSSSEGVPFTYKWKRCQVVPYVGDGQSAGREAATRSASTDNNGSDSGSATATAAVSALTLVATFPKNSATPDVPPSLAYRDLLVRGARESQFDKDYLGYLQSTPVGRTFGRGIIAGDLLQIAEWIEQRKLKKT